MQTVTPLCRAELPSAVHTQQGTKPIRCSKSEQCARYIGANWSTDVPVKAWACDGNRFDQFVAIELMGS